jgi:uncharacterized membrane protein YfcA
MMPLWVWIVAILAGATGEFLDALAGMGFGALSSTIMVSTGMAPVVVVATVNLAKVGSGLASGISHWRMGNVRWRWVLPLGVPAVTAGVGAALLVSHLPAQAVRTLVPVVLVVMGALILRRFLSPASAVLAPAGGSGEAVALAPRAWQLRFPRLARIWPKASLAAIGAVGGLLNGFSGAFGPFTTSAVVLRQGGHPRYAIGTVNFVEIFVAAAVSTTILSQIGGAGFNWKLPLLLMAGSFLSAPLGAYLSRRLPARFVGIFVGATLIALNAWSLSQLLFN